MHNPLKGTGTRARCSKCTYDCNYRGTFWQSPKPQKHNSGKSVCTAHEHVATILPVPTKHTLLSMKNDYRRIQSNWNSRQQSLKVHRMQHLHASTSNRCRSDVTPDVSSCNVWQAWCQPLAVREKWIGTPVTLSTCRPMAVSNLTKAYIAASVTSFHLLVLFCSAYKLVCWNMSLSKYRLKNSTGPSSAENGCFGTIGM